MQRVHSHFSKLQLLLQFLLLAYFYPISNTHFIFFFLFEDITYHIQCRTRHQGNVPITRRKNVQVLEFNAITLASTVWLQNGFCCPYQCNINHFVVLRLILHQQFIFFHRVNHFSTEYWRVFTDKQNICAHRPLSCWWLPYGNVL